MIYNLGCLEGTQWQDFQEQNWLNPEHYCTNITTAQRHCWSHFVETSRGPYLALGCLHIAAIVSPFASSPEHKQGCELDNYW